MRYDTLEEAQSRLKNTIIYYEDEPVYVRDIVDTRHGQPYGRGQEDRFTLHYYTLGRDRKGGSDTLANPAFRQNNFKLGYFNIGSGVPGTEPGSEKLRTGYLTRITTRRTKQGICQENLMVVPTERDLGNLRFGDMHLSQPVKDMLTGTYMSPEAAASHVVDRGSFSAAFHRHFAFSYDDFREDIVLLYRGHKIGFGDCEEITLGPQYKFCREAALEAGIKRIK